MRKLIFRLLQWLHHKTFSPHWVFWMDVGLMSWTVGNIEEYKSADRTIRVHGSSYHLLIKNPFTGTKHRWDWSAKEVRSLLTR